MKKNITVIIILLSTIFLGYNSLDARRIQIKRIGGIEFVYIPAGSYLMGSPKGVGYKNERPQKKIFLKGFWMSRYEVTQRLYLSIMGNNPSTFNKGGFYPVETVSWNEAVAFCIKFSKKYKTVIRLPYEKEWEYACRAGTTSMYYWGNKVNNYFVWYNMTSNDAIYNVRSKRPNRWGLYNMTGHVAEWCLDWYSENPENGNGPTSGIGKVVRGGSWADDDYWVRSAFRISSAPDTKAFTIGFRVVLSVK